MIARKLEASVYKGVGVRIGAIPASNVVNTAFGLAIRGFTDPKEFTYTDTNSLPLVPGFVLYRYQVANDAFPKVSGDLSAGFPAHRADRPFADQRGAGRRHLDH